ncbi:MAG: hypothetical protein FWC57_06555 [Endomicrobia bacterium]|nr:hypothetical protein [Endomicrobiia bacterium]
MNKFRELINSYKFQILSLFALLVLVFAVYHQCTSFGFVDMDDDTLIANKIGYMDSLSKAKDIFTNPVFDTSTDKFYRPILNFSYLIDTIISGGDAGFYHYVNVLIHAADAFLVLLALGMLGYSKKVSLIISVIFAVHPALVSAVAWLPGRNDTLLTFFTLLSFMFFIQHLKTHKNFYLFLSSFMFLAALFTKETAVVIPIVFLLYAVLHYHKAGRNAYLKMLIFAAISIIFYSAARYYALSGTTSTLHMRELIISFLSSVKITFWYIGVLFLTEKVIIYPQFSAGSVKLISGAVPLISLAALCFILRKKINFKAMLFGLAWFILFMFPTYVMPGNNFYTHRLHLPVFGFFIIIAETILPFVRAYPPSKKFFYALSIVTAALFAAISINQSKFYKDAASFWFGAYEENPRSARVNAGVARYFFSSGDMENAEKYTLAAVNFSQGRDIHRMLTAAGTLYVIKGDTAKAERYFQQAIIKNGCAVNAYFGLSRLYASQNRKEDARKTLEYGLELMPNDKLLRKGLRLLDEKEEAFSSNISVN